MNHPLGSIAAAYKRLRHSYGFGVHSPAAYRCVRDVIMKRRGYAYYAYDDIDCLLDTSSATCRRDKRRARMLHRLAAHYPCEVMDSDPRLPLAWQEALRRGWCRRDGGGMIVVTYGIPRTFPVHGIVVLFGLSREDMRHLSDGRSTGILLAGTDAAIIICSPSIRFVAYTVIL